ncbi:unnamed protein product [Gongylonema pulchrum]|uniref:Hemagglutinin n=1 Tax=Gongylonema pulchrum TaxID=637853 RepID=A0A183F0C5_9BILA|nr:unnamed protein product [Gongylonema pulchrum]VDN46970.1 unnamed protein product [Gongylonema pulchrum]
MKQKQYCNAQRALLALLLSIVVAITFLGILSSRMMSQLDLLSNDRKYEVITRELEIVQREMHKIKTDIDMLRLMTSSPGTPTWNTSTLLSSRLEHIENQIDDIVEKIQVIVARF